MPSAVPSRRSTKEASDPTVNLMPALIEAARQHVTVGESMRALESVFGLYTERQRRLTSREPATKGAAGPE